LKKIFISAGDPSGDMHAAILMRKIRQLQPDVEFIGIGGNNMIKEGLRSLVKLSDISVVGFWEVAKKFFFFNELLNKAKQLLKDEKVDVFVPIDYPGFNIRLAGYAKSIHIPVIYYIAPQLWAWGNNRAKILAKCVDKLLVVFPFEEHYFQNFGINTSYVGHPILDVPEFTQPFKIFDERENLIAFFPGSRLQEVKRHLKFFEDFYNIKNNFLPDYRFGIALSKNINPAVYEKFAETHPDIEMYSDSVDLMKTAKAGIIKTGTSNLEAALSGLPFAMFYKTSYITFKMAERMINLPYISLVNILANKFVVKEFIQKDAKVDLIFQHLRNILENKQEYSDIQNNFALMRTALGIGGASENAARIILKNI
jgi:lipid-A-disaccharide synthase